MATLHISPTRNDAAALRVRIHAIANIIDAIAIPRSD